MRYNNDFFIQNGITKQVAAMMLADKKPVWAVPNCGCPDMPDAEILKPENYPSSTEEILQALADKFICYAAEPTAEPLLTETEQEEATNITLKIKKK